MSVPAALPTVSGRHRNRALAAARQVRAVELATEGATYQAIADELGYANRGTVHHIVHQALARHGRGAVENQELCATTSTEGTTRSGVFAQVRGPVGA